MTADAEVYDLPALANGVVTNVEALSMATGQSETLILNRNLLNAITDDRNTLRLHADADDSILVGGGWTQQAARREIDGIPYIVLNQAGSTLLADVAVRQDDPVPRGSSPLQAFGAFSGSLLTEQRRAAGLHGARMVVGDFTGNGSNEVVAVPSSGSPRLRLMDANSGEVLNEIQAFDPSFGGGVYLAAGDLNGDGIQDVIAGAGESGGPHIRVFDVTSGETIRDFFAYDVHFRGGVRVAAGDLNGDGTVDIITAPGPGGGPHIKAFDGKTGQTIRDFFAYDTAFFGGVYVASSDVNGDGIDDIITGAGPTGGPHVRVFSGRDGSRFLDFFAYSTSDRRGVQVGAIDANQDGFADIMVTPATGSGETLIFSGKDGSRIDRSVLPDMENSQPRSARQQSRLIGANLAPELLRGISDRQAFVNHKTQFELSLENFFDGDGDSLTLSATLSNGQPLPMWITFDPENREFVGTATLADLGTTTIRVTAEDGRGGRVEDDFTLTVRESVTNGPFDSIILGADFGHRPEVVVIDSETGAVRSRFLAYEEGFTGGVRVAFADVTGDGLGDIITAAGYSGGPHIKVFDGATGNVAHQFFAYERGFSGGVFIAAADVDGDGIAEIITGTGPGGGPHVKVFKGSGQLVTSLFAYDSSFRGGVNVAVGDVNGDGRADIITSPGPGGGPHVKVFDAESHAVLMNFISHDTSDRRGIVIAAADFDADGVDDVVSIPVSGSRTASVFRGSDATRLGPQAVQSSHIQTGQINGQPALLSTSTRTVSINSDGDIRDLDSLPNLGPSPHITAGLTLDTIFSGESLFDSLSE